MTHAWKFLFSPHGISPESVWFDKKLSQSLYILKQLKHCFNTECLRILYFSLVHSHLLYGLICWGQGNSALLKQTEKLQKRAVRIISKAKYNSHTEPLFKKHYILKLQDQYEYNALKFIFDYRQHSLPKTFDHLLVLNRQLPNSRDTRQSELYHIPRSRTDFIAKLPLFTMPKIWNKWSMKYNAINELSRNSQFKNNIRNRMFAGYSEQVNCLNPYCLDCKNV